MLQGQHKGAKDQDQGPVAAALLIGCGVEQGRQHRDRDHEGRRDPDNPVGHTGGDEAVDVFGQLGVERAAHPAVHRHRHHCPCDELHEGEQLFDEVFVLHEGGQVGGTDPGREVRPVVHPGAGAVYGQAPNEHHELGRAEDPPRARHLAELAHENHPQQQGHGGDASECVTGVDPEAEIDGQGVDGGRVRHHGHGQQAQHHPG